MKEGYGYVNLPSRVESGQHNKVLRHVSWSELAEMTIGVIPKLKSMIIKRIGGLAFGKLETIKKAPEIWTEPPVVVVILFVFYTSPHLTSVPGVMAQREKVNKKWHFYAFKRSTTMTTTTTTTTTT